MSDDKSIRLTRPASERIVTRDTGYTSNDGIFDTLVQNEIGKSIEHIGKDEPVPPGYERNKGF